MFLCWLHRGLMQADVLKEKTHLKSNIKVLCFNTTRNCYWRSTKGRGSGICWEGNGERLSILASEKNKLLVLHYAP